MDVADLDRRIDASSCHKDEMGCTAESVRQCILVDLERAQPYLDAYCEALYCNESLL